MAKLRRQSQNKKSSSVVDAADNPSYLSIGPLRRLTATSMSTELWRQLESMSASGASATELLKLIVDNCTNINSRNLTSASEVLIAVAAVGTQSSWSAQQNKFIADLFIPAAREFAEKELARNPIAQQKITKLNNDNEQLQAELQFLRDKLHQSNSPKENQQDGPGAAGEFIWHDVKCSGLEPTPWKLLKLAWESPHHCASFESLCEVWDGDDWAEQALKQAVSKVNRLFKGYGVPLRMTQSVRSRTVSIKGTE